MKERLLAWFERHTHGPTAIYLLAVIAFFESFIFPVPVDIFVVLLSVAHPQKWLKYGIVSTVFSVLGALFAYLLGAELFDVIGQPIIEAYGLESAFEAVKTLFDKNTFLVILTAAFTPIPFKVFTLTGGLLNVPFLPFLIGSIIGRGVRFMLEAYLPYRFHGHLPPNFQRNLNRYSLLVMAIIIIIMLLVSVL